MAQIIEDVMAAAPVYRDLTPHEIADLVLGVELRRFRSGDTMMLQGAESDGAYVITSGAVTIAERLPGGGETVIAELGPGDLVGEMALLMRGGRRTATARAKGDVEALFIDRRYFAAGLHLLRPASLKVLRRLSLTIAERLRAVRRHIRGLVDGAHVSDLFRPPPVGDEHPPSDFDVRAFMAILPSLREFDANEIDGLFAAARVDSVRGGSPLREQGEAADGCRLVIRGAMLLGQRHGERLHQLDILGPGRFVGAASMLDCAQADCAVIAVEDATLLAFDARRFTDLWNGQDRLALRLLETITTDLVISLDTESNHLARLAAQARMRALADGE